MKDIKEEIREIVRGVGNQALIEKEMVIGSDIIEDKVSRLVKLFNKQLDNNTKSVKKESVEKLEEMKGAVIKGTGKKWLVEDYISRKQAIKEIK